MQTCINGMQTCINGMQTCINGMQTCINGMQTSHVEHVTVLKKRKRNKKKVRQRIFASKSTPFYAFGGVFFRIDVVRTNILSKKWQNISK